MEAGRRGASGRPVQGRVEPESRAHTETVITQCKSDFSDQNADVFLFLTHVLQLNLYLGRIKV